jgi:DNA-binding Lrp family transcriptional regulator
MFPDRPPSRSETDEEPTTPALELYVRSLSADTVHGPRESVLERLSRLEREGVVAEYTVHVWGRRVSPETAARTEAGRFLLDRIERFRDRSRRNATSTRSFFEPHEVTSSITGESYTAVTVPSLALAEFRDGALRRVTPSADGGTVRTVEDHLDAIEAAGATDRAGTAVPAPTPPFGPEASLETGGFDR